MTTLFFIIILATGVCWGLLLHWGAQIILAGDTCASCISQRQTKIISLLISPIILLLVTSIISINYLPALLFFISALLIATITDLQALLISRFTSLFLIPIGWTCAFLEFLPINLLTSIVGSVFGYILLYITARIFYAVTKKEGLGEGDYEILALIGAFTGIIGVWLSLFIGCVIGSIIGLGLLTIGKTTRTTLIPFGPFLALGALTYTLYGSTIIKLLLPSC